MVLSEGVQLPRARRFMCMVSVAYVCVYVWSGPRCEITYLVKPLRSVTGVRAASWMCKPTCVQFSSFWYNPGFLVPLAWFSNTGRFADSWVVLYPRSSACWRLCCSPLPGVGVLWHLWKLTLLCFVYGCCTVLPLTCPLPVLYFVGWAKRWVGKRVC